ncbi:transglutaminase-like domain-containing protein [Methanobrevibacter curvatus]|uniref:Transglutaminase-like superfamily protein n=1 Tax=Methanobrevibacter curvatus TaxID=49547 RepID=A0A166A3M8_9EURY|nr:transglutaminase-like domain-containing protein [Methanobrevibacter curvatus]KZX11522.1 transglutaminase-like superfamily protein [Methanobrevibacter curvatus]
MKKPLLLIVACFILLSVGACYGSNVCDIEENINDNEDDSDGSGNINNIKLSLNNNNNNTNNSNNKPLSVNTVKPKTLSQKEIINVAKALNSYVKKNKKLPNYVTIKKYKFSIAEFSYMASKTVYNKYKNLKSKITVKHNIKNPSKPLGDNFKGKVSKKLYSTYAKSIVNFIDKNNRMPNYLSYKGVKVQYQTYVYWFSRLLEKSGSKLPKSFSLSIAKNNKINKYLPKYSSQKIVTPSKSKEDNGFNDNYKLNDKLTKKEKNLLNTYLKATKNCQSTNRIIKELSKSITKKCKTTIAKATAIYKWVQKNIDYVLYYNTKFGAVKTKTKGYGNCVDQAHISASLYRAAGIAARYVHGKCKFTSGVTYGHVWVQVLIGDTWVVSDTTSLRNSLGNVKNWDMNKYLLKGKYNEIKF